MVCILADEECASQNIEPALQRKKKLSFHPDHVFVVNRKITKYSLFSKLYFFNWEPLNAYQSTRYCKGYGAERAGNGESLGLKDNVEISL